jgi:hypothetical protein
MKRLAAAFLIGLIAMVPSLLAEGTPDAKAKARAEYPTPLCIVSGEHLEGGKIVEIVYQEEGKPDRLVRLCCHKCETRFKANPAKYLEKLDAAADRAAPPAKH